MFKSSGPSIELCEAPYNMSANVAILASLLPLRRVVVKTIDSITYPRFI